MNKKILPLIALAALGLVGCRENETSSSTPESTTSDSTVADEFITVDWKAENRVSEGSISGALIDVGINLVFSVGIDYQGTIGFGNFSTAGAYVTVSDNGVAEASIDDNGNVTFKGLRAGESILCIYASDGYLYFRNKLTFRPTMETEAEIVDFMVNSVDHYTSIVYAGMNISFVSATSGMVYGSDEGIAIEPAITFTIDYRGIVNDEHHFVVQDWQNQSYSSLTFVDIYVSTNGYSLHPMTSGGVVDLFEPVFSE